MSPPIGTDPPPPLTTHPHRRRRATRTRAGARAALVAGLGSAALLAGLVTAAPASADVRSVHCDGGTSTESQIEEECLTLFIFYRDQGCTVAHANIPEPAATDTLTVTCPGAVPTPPGGNPGDNVGRDDPPIGAVEYCDLVDVGDGPAETIVCAGYASDPDSPGTALGVTVYVGGPVDSSAARVLGTGTTGTAATDSQVLAEQRDTFVVALPAHEPELTDEVISVWIEVTGVDESGAPNVVDTRIWGSPAATGQGWTCDDGTTITAEQTDALRATVRELFDGDEERALQHGSMCDALPAVTDAIGEREPAQLLPEPVEVAGPPTLDPAFPGQVEVEQLGADCARWTFHYELGHPVFGHGTSPLFPEGNVVPVEATVWGCARLLPDNDPLDPGPVGPTEWVVTGPGGVGEPEVVVTTGQYGFGDGLIFDVTTAGTAGFLVGGWVPYSPPGSSVEYDQGAWQAYIGLNINTFANVILFPPAGIPSPGGGGTVDTDAGIVELLPALNYEQFRN